MIKIEFEKFYNALDKVLNKDCPFSETGKSAKETHLLIINGQSCDFEKNKNGETKALVVFKEKLANFSFADSFFPDYAFTSFLDDFIAKNFLKNCIFSQNNDFRSLQIGIRSTYGEADARMPAIKKFVTYFFGEISEIGIFNLNLVLRELITNAIRHGNREDESKSVVISIYIKEKNNKLLIKIQDQGEGFDFFGNFTAEKNKNDILREKHRGLSIIHEYCENITTGSGEISVEFLIK
ncbi:MAG: hypothetical protein CSB55_02275 [Candidatus Cloacimonadota bacterium]|nr:MAG: hypothetical protein CSB55_02275 [Candidatus Cloacimonadota bacterium]